MQPNFPLSTCDANETSLSSDSFRVTTLISSSKDVQIICYFYEYTYEYQVKNIFLLLSLLIKNVVTSCQINC